MTGNHAAFTAISNTLRSVFSGVFPYHAMIPSFSFDWGFHLASFNIDPLGMTAQEIDRRLSDRSCDSLLSYDGEAHHGLFKMNKHLRLALQNESNIITEDNPLIVV